MPTSLLRRITRLGRRHASEPVIRQTSPRGDTIYWIGPAGDAREGGEGTDFHAVATGAVSVTPLQVDLTDHAALPAWRAWLAGLLHERSGGQSSTISAAARPGRRAGSRPAQELLRPQAPLQQAHADARGARRPARARFGRRGGDGAAPAGAGAAARGRPPPRCRGARHPSSMPRSPPRPTRTPACRSAWARPSPPSVVARA